jgi:transcriptional regulator of acetoin/glycerol metabolism
VALRVFEEWQRGLLGDLERIELLEDGRVVEQVQRETLLSVDEAARRLGMSRWALYARLRRRGLGVHLHGRVLVPAEQLASLR